MSLGLTRKLRVSAGRLLVLAYLFCVLSPGVALAFARGAAPCFDDGMVAVAVSHHPAQHALDDGAMPRMRIIMITQSRMPVYSRSRIRRPHRPTTITARCPAPAAP